MTRILVTGATGLLGQVMVTDLAEDHDVVGVVHERRFTGDRPRQVTLDLTDDRRAREVWTEVQPELVLHTAALASIDRCESDPDLARTLNRDVVALVARLCRDHGSRLVHVSTDAVFDGTTGPYREEDPVGPLSVYARTKLDGEQVCLDLLPEALVARVNFFGPSGPPRRGLAAFFLDALARGAVVDGFSDVEFTPVYSRDLVEVLLAASAAGISGVRHVGGRDPLSKLAFGRLVAEVFGHDPHLVREASVDALGAHAQRAHRLCLDSGLLSRELGRPMPSAREGLERMRRDLESGYEARLVRELTATIDR